MGTPNEGVEKLEAGSSIGLCTAALTGVATTCVSHSLTIQEPSSSFNTECAPLWDCAQEKEKSWVNVCLTFPLRESLLDLQRKAKHRCSKWPHAMTGLEQCQCPKC